MTDAARSANRYLDRPSPSSLADVFDTILDKGRLTYLRFAEAVNRLDRTENGTKLTELLEGS